MSFDSKELDARLSASAVKKTFTLSLLTLAVHTLLHPALAAESTQQPDIIVEASVDDTQSGSQDYTVKTTRAGTKMRLAPRDIPQSLSVITEQRMQDQNLQSIGDALKNTTGVSANIYDSERSSFYSRGFQINNYTFDDIPTTVNEAWNFGDAAGDTAIYDRIEVVRGATGLMTGAGNPAASVNMVRKHADSREFTGKVDASYGSWDQQRYVAALSAPLNETGSGRGLVVPCSSLLDRWLDRHHNR